MEKQIVIESPDGAFRAYISRPAKLPAPAVVVLQELFGVNADIRATCDELAAQGFIAIAPDLFWRQEPGVDLDVASEADWQHGLRLYAAYDRDAGAKDIMETVRTAVELPESTGRVALQGYCLGALMAFITAVRYEVDAAVAYHGGDTEKYLGEVGGLDAPLLMHLGEEDEFISKTAQAQIKAALAGKANAAVYSYPGQRHAFSRHNGLHYNAAAAALANRRTSEFLHQHCGDLVAVECDMTQVTTPASVSSRAIAVEHVRISSGRSFAEVRRKLEGTVPKLDTSIAEALHSADQKRAKDYEENGPKLSIFGERDHGASLQIAGRTRNALQYEIGNPLTASKMTRYQLPAALYAPLRVVLFEDDQGRGIFEYDKPSSFFSQYGDERVTEVGRYLDATLEAVLRNAAE